MKKKPAIPKSTTKFSNTLKSTGKGSNQISTVRGKAKNQTNAVKKVPKNFRKSF